MRNVQGKNGMYKARDSARTLSDFAVALDANLRSHIA